MINDLSCYVRFLPNNRGVVAGGAVYKLLVDGWKPARKRTQIKRINEPVTGESVLMERQKTFLPRKARRDTSVKLPKLQSRPTTQQSILRKRIPVA